MAFPLRKNFEPAITTGTVRWYNAQVGFGYIQLDSGAGDILVYSADVHMAGFVNLYEGQKLAFEIAIKNGQSHVRQLTAVH